jgi:hypothetical protein
MNYPIYVLTFVAALGSGFMAGIFFAFSNFVMKNKLRYFPSNLFPPLSSALNQPRFSRNAIRPATRPSRDVKCGAFAAAFDSPTALRD